MLTLLHSEWPKLGGLLAILSAIGLISNWATINSLEILVYGAYV